MGCVSSNDVQENDPPIEKAEATTNHNIPEIQINGPSNSPSKENGLSNNHVSPHPPSQTPHKIEAEEEDKAKGGGDAKEGKDAPPEPPLFPHVSPFKPQFDYKRDVTLSPRASRYLEMNGNAGSVQHSPGGTLQQQNSPSSDSYTQNPTSAGGEDDLNTSYMESENDFKPLEDSYAEEGGRGDVQKGDFTPVVVDESRGQQDNGNEKEKEPAKATLDLDEDDNEDPSTPLKTVTPPAVEQEESGSTPLQESERGEEGEGADTTTTTQTISKPDNDNKEAEDKTEDRSAILASFLANQAEPDVVASDEEGDAFEFSPRADQDAELLANQVEDEDMTQSEAPPHPLTQTQEEEGKGDTAGEDGGLSLLAKCTDENGDMAPFSEEARAKVNELLNEIESVAERNGFFNA